MLSVLIADDELFFCQLICDILTESTSNVDDKYRITCVDTLAKCKAIVRTNPPDVLFLDLTFPDSPPDRTINEIGWVADRTAVIVATGQGYEWAEETVRRKGAQCFLNKTDFIRLIRDGGIQPLILNAALRQQRISDLALRHHRLCLRFERMEEALSVV